MKYALGVLFALVCIVMSAVLIFSCVNKQNTVRGDISSYIDRAQVSANAADMAGYVTEARLGMERYEMTGGHAALIWKRPDNDMALIYAAVLSLEERAVTQGDRFVNDPEYSTTTTYQVALDDLRGALRELEMQDQAYYWRHGGLAQVAMAWIGATGLIIIAILAIILGVVWQGRR